MRFIIILSFLIHCLPRAAGHATYVTTTYCSRSLMVGTPIMVGTAAADTSRSIVVKRGATTLLSGSTYVPGETLSVEISSSVGEYVFETSAGSFSGGGCAGKRYANGAATLVMPSAGSGATTIIGAWAPAQSTVRIMSSFTLEESGATAPVLTPTKAPTSSAMLTVVGLEAVQVLGNLTASDIQNDPAAITALQTTLKQVLVQSMSSFATPTNVTCTRVVPHEVEQVGRLRLRAEEVPMSGPEDGPDDDKMNADKQAEVTYLITYTLEDTQYTTPDDLLESVSIGLSVVMDSPLFLSSLRAFDIRSLADVSSSQLISTAVNSVDALNSPQPTLAPTTEPQGGLQSNDDAYDGSAATKLIVGLVVGCVSVLLAGCAVYCFVSAEDESTSSVVVLLSKFPVAVALGAAAVAVGLVAAWATDSTNESDYGFLGVPSWSSNVFAYHPVFMVLFFAAQVQAITNWSLFSLKLTAKTAHVLVQVCAVATMITALVAVVKFTLDNRSPSLVSMHAWIGVAAVAVFCFNFLWGGTMNYLTIYHPESKLRSRLHPLLGHKFLGATALFLSAVAINTGMMDQLPRGACSYILSEGAAYQRDTDPAENYQYIPASCRIANGLGVAVIVAAMFTFMAMLVRNANNLALPIGSSTSATTPQPREQQNQQNQQLQDEEGEIDGDKRLTSEVPTPLPGTEYAILARH